MSKGAIEQVSRVLAKDLGARGMTVNTVSPGPVDTALFRAGKPQKVMDFIASQNPNNRLALPEDIAPMVAFLASPAAQWVNGQNIRVNGVSPRLNSHYVSMVNLTHALLFRRVSLCKCFAVTVCSETNIPFIPRLFVKRQLISLGSSLVLYGQWRIMMRGIVFKITPDMEMFPVLYSPVSGASNAWGHFIYIKGARLPVLLTSHSSH